jgi:hypothetical protein
MPTRIEFDSSHSLTVDQDLNDVEGKLRQAPPAPAALVEFTKKERKFLVNAALVRSVHEVAARTGKMRSL